MSNSPITGAQALEAIEIVFRVLSCHVHVNQHQLEAARTQLRALLLNDHNAPVATTPLY